jgi:hypothetical protein
MAKVPYGSTMMGKVCHALTPCDSYAKQTVTHGLPMASHTEPLQCIEKQPHALL